MEYGESDPRPDQTPRWVMALRILRTRFCGIDPNLFMLAGSMIGLPSGPIIERRRVLQPDAIDRHDIHLLRHVVEYPADLFDELHPRTDNEA